jgi:hypothetical protein
MLLKELTAPVGLGETYLIIPQGLRLMAHKKYYQNNNLQNALSSPPWVGLIRQAPDGELCREEKDMNVKMNDHFTQAFPLYPVEITHDMDN